MSDSGEVIAALLEANAEFYRAFRTGDMTAMASLWADDDDILCIHPGHATVQGRADVLESWFDILAGPPDVVVGDTTSLIQGTTGIVVCIEQIGTAHLSATNLFRMDDGLWRMIHHHGSQIFASMNDGGPLVTAIH
jgi:ketosteroid isomerase-like protein